VKTDTYELSKSEEHDFDYEDTLNWNEELIDSCPTCKEDNNSKNQTNEGGIQDKQPFEESKTDPTTGAKVHSSNQLLDKERIPSQKEVISVGNLQAKKELQRHKSQSNYPINDSGESWNREE
jgi:hypothetical protein